MRIETFILFIIVFRSFGISAQTLTLKYQDYIDQVKGKNYELKIENSKVQAAQAKSKGISLPPPMVSLTQMRQGESETVNGYEISQMIPFPSKIHHDSTSRQNELHMQELGSKARSVQILAESRLLYYHLWAVQRKIDLLKEKKEALEEHLRLTRSSVRSDSFASAHLLKTESDRDLLDIEIESERQSQQKIQADLFLQMGQEPGDALIIVEELSLPQVSELKNDVSADAVQIQSLEKGLEVARSREKEASASWLPDLTLKYKEVGASSMSVSSKEWMVGMTLPFLFFWEPQSISKMASAERLQAEYELEKSRRSVKLQHGQLMYKLKSIEKQYRDYQEKIIPRAVKRMKVTHNIAPRDMESLIDHREAKESLPEYKLRALELRTQLEENYAELQKIGGD
ncbi:MAG: hypothetical protein BroJett040_24510 [Oligoflexia bacterium]|nr:MAG: hypothetical protein BroJett040_24510 [Oligoflexia bacterium]